MKNVDLEELVVGVRKADLNGLKELKVKLPVRLLVNLHFVKLTESRAISEIVNEALTQYFVAMASTGSSKVPLFDPLALAADHVLDDQVPVSPRVVVR